MNIHTVSSVNRFSCRAIASVVCLVAISGLSACGGSTPSGWSAPTYDTSTITKHIPEGKNTDDVSGTVPNPKPAGYDETYAKVTDPTVRRIFEDGKVTYGEVAEGNALLEACLGSKGFSTSADGATIAPSDIGKADALSDAIFDCTEYGPTYQWIRMMEFIPNAS
ncbi:hypothetical protein G1C96_0891 [Bifidobacterium sp. DSM 109958]|uniref:Lipoprotein n=1 Tax=Bifidobacterium moraviense TaxID=2675323 RepID=A0A7Y0F1J7_9BIFI|nr:hypothetical protein [Bifidobacterium sp. DSM 109958]NMN00313.1 hypothetical protein [Bifidobacterium sp. DSM 109958]